MSVAKQNAISPAPAPLSPAIRTFLDGLTQEIARHGCEFAGGRDSIDLRISPGFSGAQGTHDISQFVVDGANALGFITAQKATGGNLDLLVLDRNSHPPHRSAFRISISGISGSSAVPETEQASSGAMQSKQARRSMLAPFITFSGADGVGKSTLIETMLARLADWRIPARSFHYRGIRKSYLAQQKVESSSGGVARNSRGVSSPAPALLRFAKRAARKSSRSVRWIASKSREWRVESVYTDTINKELAEAFQKHELLLIDRYWYDRIVQVETAPELRKQSKLIAHILCWRSKKPACSFLVWDEPRNIYSRKQEIPLEEISHFQNRLTQLIERYSKQSYVMRVSGKTPSELADIALRELFIRLGSYIIDLYDFHNKARGESGIPDSSGTADAGIQG